MPDKVDPNGEGSGGRAAGGRARMKALTKAQQSDLGRRAANRRWGNQSSLEEKFLHGECFPQLDVPFATYLKDVFYTCEGDLTSDLNHRKSFPDHVIHCPNVIRIVPELFGDSQDSEKLSRLRGNGILRDDESLKAFLQNQDHIHRELRNLGIDDVTGFLKVAALYHDIGKSLRRANHPQLGSNILQNFETHEREALLGLLDFDARKSRRMFKVLVAITEHHDRFGVMNTGEASLLILLDLLDYAVEKPRTAVQSDGPIEVAKAAVTAVMAVNLADIAAVWEANKAPKDRLREAWKLAREIAMGQEPEEPLRQILTLCKEQNSFMGLKEFVHNVFEDWKLLLEQIEAANGNRLQLQQRLLEAERDPARAIERIQRLLETSLYRCGASVLRESVSPVLVEATLRMVVGNHDVLSFCERLALAAKLDYFIYFVDDIVSGCIRAELYGSKSFAEAKKRVADLSGVDYSAFRGKLHEDEVSMLTNSADKLEIVSQVAGLVIRVLYCIIGRALPPDVSGRVALQTRNLLDDKIREEVVRMLCYEKRSQLAAFTLIADEVMTWRIMP